MRIKFNRAYYGVGEYAPAQEVKKFEKPVSWMKVLRRLKDDCPYGQDFNVWAKETWGITFLKEDGMFTEHISGIDIPDENLTMLLLKYPTN